MFLSLTLPSMDGKMGLTRGENGTSVKNMAKQEQIVSDFNKLSFQGNYYHTGYILKLSCKIIATRNEIMFRCHLLMKVFHITHSFLLNNLIFFLEKVPKI